MLTSFLKIIINFLPSYFDNKFTFSQEKVLFLNSVMFSERPEDADDLNVIYRVIEDDKMLLLRHVFPFNETSAFIIHQ